jgi:hypothetical protein
MKKLAAIVHHASGVRAMVASLDVDGVIAGELIDHRGTLTLRLIVYAGDGGMRSLNEITLKDRRLGLDDFAVIRQNLSEEAASLAPKADAPPQQPPKQVAKATVKAAPVAPSEPEIEMDATDAAPATADSVADDAAPGDPAETHSPDDDAPVATTTSESETPIGDPEDPRLALRLGVGLGVVSRSFSPGPSTVTGYSSAPVGAVSVAAEIQPAKRLCLDALAERSVAMQTPMGQAMAPTSMSRWEVSADYFVKTGRFALAARAGLGRRAFAIDTNLVGRTPDSSYNYLVLGAQATAAVTPRITLRGLAALEPVVSGTEQTEMAFGEAQRWAIDVGGAVEVRVRDHVYARFAADVQRFAWSWTGAGQRGAGGAVDMFPSAIASVGAAY